MKEYTPDKWAIMKSTLEDSTVYKILAGWSGGYTTGDAWRLSSGVTNVEEKDNSYIIHNHSGSVYICSKDNEGLSVLTSSIFDDILKQAKQAEIDVSLVTIDEYLNDSKET